MRHEVESAAAGVMTGRHPAWAPLLPVTASAGGLPGVALGAVRAFDDPAAETAAAFGGAAVVVPLLTLGALRVTGDDRIEFLHAQTSNDVRSLRPGQGQPALLLDHRGRPHADLLVVRRTDDVYLAVDDGRGPRVRRSLEAHVVFDQVVIEDLGERLAALLVAGAAARAALARIVGAAELPAPGRIGGLTWRGAGVLLHARPRGLDEALDVHLLAEHLPALWAALLGAGTRPVGEGVLAAARVRAGLAAAAAEGEAALPQEAGLDDRVSYRKGCYLGQEIMARVEARGSLKRSLARLALDAAPKPAAGEADLEVHGEGRVVGRVGTVAQLPDRGWAALAVLRSDLGVGAEVVALGVPARVAARLPSPPT
jgi:tRNA-modifying protein YgfZ